MHVFLHHFTVIVAIYVFRKPCSLSQVICLLLIFIFVLYYPLH